jgi:hypothetical protein
MVAAGYIIPKPAAVGLTIISVTDIDETAYVGFAVSGLETATITIDYP